VYIEKNPSQSQNMQAPEAQLPSVPRLPIPEKIDIPFMSRSGHFRLTPSLSPPEFRDVSPTQLPWLVYPILDVILVQHPCHLECSWSIRRGQKLFQLLLVDILARDDLVHSISRMVGKTGHRPVSAVEACNRQAKQSGSEMGIQTGQRREEIGVLTPRRKRTGLSLK